MFFFKQKKFRTNLLYFFYRTLSSSSKSKKIKVKLTSESDNSDGFSEDENDENDDVDDEMFEEEKKMLFIYQDKEMKRLYQLYAPTLVLLDATYKTTKYAIPLFFLVSYFSNFVLSN